MIYPTSSLLPSFLMAYLLAMLRIVAHPANAHTLAKASHAVHNTPLRLLGRPSRKRLVYQSWCWYGLVVVGFSPHGFGEKNFIILSVGGQDVIGMTSAALMGRKTLCWSGVLGVKKKVMGAEDLQRWPMHAGKLDTYGKRCPRRASVKDIASWRTGRGEYMMDNYGQQTNHPRRSSSRVHTPSPIAESFDTGEASPRPYSSNLEQVPCEI